MNYDRVDLYRMRSEHVFVDACGMIEVRSGVLLGSMGDALAVVSRARSIRKQYKVTHVLTLCNERPEWNKEEEEGAGDGISQSGVSGDSHAEQEQGDCDPVSGEGGTSVKGEGGDGVTVRRSQDAPERLKRDEDIQTMFVQVADMPSSDLLHHFEPCCQFIKQATQHGTVLVHWYATTPPPPHNVTYITACMFITTVSMAYLAV